MNNHSYLVHNDTIHDDYTVMSARFFKRTPDHSHHMVALSRDAWYNDYCERGSVTRVAVMVIHNIAPRGARHHYFLYATW